MASRGRSNANKRLGQGNGFEEWGGYREAKKHKLHEQFNTENEGSAIFKGVAVYINGYTKPSSDELRRLLTLHGGRFEQYLYKRRVTHIVASNLPDSKIHSLKRMNVVRPEWITESVQAGRLLPYTSYLLYGSAANSITAFGRSATHSVQSNMPSHDTHTGHTTHDNTDSDHSNIDDDSDIGNSDIPDDAEVNRFNVSDFLDDSDKSCSPNSNTAVVGNEPGKTTLVNARRVVETDKELDNRLTALISTNSDKPQNNEQNNGSLQDIETRGHANECGAKDVEESNKELNLTNSDTGGVNHKNKTAKPSATASNPGFVSEFYSHSRLHHISTSGQQFKEYVSKLQKRGDGRFPGREALRKYHLKKVGQARESVDDAREPVDDAREPVDDAREPVDDAREPVDDARQPVDDARQPVDDARQPVDDAREPVDDAREPVDDAREPVHDAREPVHDAREPVDDARQPVDDAKEPVDDAREPVDVSRQPVHGRPNKVIMHIDMDCFFVSVGLRDRPELIGKPVAVTHSKGQRVSDSVDGKFSSMAEIASCSYEARKAGVRNGMFMCPALELCPDLVPVPYEFDKYQQVSQTLYDTVASYTHDIEAVSCDELLVDCTDLLAATGAGPLEFATILREDINTKTGCNASAGLASNILLARLATRSAKPNGQFYLDSRDVTDFMAKQSVKDLPGVGWSMCRKLTSLNVKTCGDLQNIPLSALQKEFGPKTGQNLYKSCRGEDYRQIQMDKQRKSVSAEINYGIRFQKDTEAMKFLEELSDEVCNRLKQLNKKGKTITLKLMVRRRDAPTETPKYLGHGKCDSFSKSTTLPVSTDDVTTISRQCMSMLKSQHIDTTDIRGVGIQIHRLESSSLGPSSGAKDTQTILSFPVAQRSGLVSETPAPCVKRAAVTSSSTDHSDTVEPAVTSSPAHTAGQSSRKLSLDRRDFDTVDVLLDDDLDGILGNDLKNADVEEESTSFLCTNRTILEELSRRKNAKTVPPPLPTFPDVFVSPEAQTSDPAQSKDYFPSPSQIDPEVLKELPPEIRIQVEQDMSRRRSEKNSVNVSETTGGSQEPGCSHWSGQAKETTNQKTSMPERSRPSLNEEKDSKNTKLEPLPSPSQLDMSCLNALPEYLQNEIRLGYAQQNKIIAEPSSPRKQNMLQLQQATSPSKRKTSPTKKRSPAKTASPSRRKRNSPVFKVPQNKPGRRRKLSAKKLEFTKKRAIVPILEDKRKHEEDDTRLSPIPRDPAVEDDTSVDERDVPINLCGAVSLSQVKDLLMEWLTSSPVPQEEDVNVMTSYLGQLVEDRNLEMVDLVLKCLHRMIRKLTNHHWRISFDVIVDNTQDIVLACHGSRLKTDWLAR